MNNYAFPSLDEKEEAMQYMHLTPAFIVEQKRRYDELNNYGHQMKGLVEHFISYANYGKKLCEDLNAIRESFSNIDFICTDPKFSPFLNSLSWVSKAFETHFNTVESQISVPLAKYTEEDLPSLADKEKEYQKSLQNYSLAEEKYISTPSNAKQAIREERQQNITMSHTLLALGFFDFSSKMESLELSLKTFMLESVCSIFLHILIPNL